MFKQWFQFSSIADAAPREGVRRNGTVVPAPERPAESEPAGEPPSASTVGFGGSVIAGKFASFEEIYRNAPVKPPKVAYGILKVAEMANSPHLAGMPAEAKSSSLLMALEAAGVQIEGLLQDAMARQRALNDYEEAMQKRLAEFEACKLEENRNIQADLDRLTAAYMTRIQANLDEVARQEDTFRMWKKRKQQESEHIAEAAAFCAPQARAGNGGSLAAMVARCGADAIAGAR